jgi:hypothetical protein
MMQPPTVLFVPLVNSFVHVSGGEQVIELQPGMPLQ